MTEYQDLPRQADERNMLVAFLDWQRSVLERKCLGLSNEQLRARPYSCPLGVALPSRPAGGLPVWENAAGQLNPGDTGLKEPRRRC